MLPHYDSPLPTLYEPQPQPPKPRLMFKMPRVVPDQKSKFESDELFRRLARETEVRVGLCRPACRTERGGVCGDLSVCLCGGMSGDLPVAMSARPCGDTCLLVVDFRCLCICTFTDLCAFDEIGPSYVCIT